MESCIKGLTLQTISQKVMFLKISRHTVQLICVIMLLLIQFDICTPLMDTISHQMEQIENTMTEGAENEASEEVYYRAEKNQQIKAKGLIIDICTFFNSIFLPTISIQGESPVPKTLGRKLQQHIIYCVYRI